MLPGSPCSTHAHCAKCPGMQRLKGPKAWSTCVPRALEFLLFVLVWLEQGSYCTNSPYALKNLMGCR